MRSSAARLARRFNFFAVYAEIMHSGPFNMMLNSDGQVLLVDVNVADETTADFIVVELLSTLTQIVRTLGKKRPANPKETTSEHHIPAAHADNHKPTQTTHRILRGHGRFPIWLPNTPRSTNGGSKVKGRIGYSNRQ